MGQSSHAAVCRIGSETQDSAGIPDLAPSDLIVVVPVKVCALKSVTCAGSRMLLLSQDIMCIAKEEKADNRPAPESVHPPNG